MNQRSRLLFLLLLLAYVGVTPVGVFTCVCFVPNHSLEPMQVGPHDFSEPTALPHTAVANILSYFSFSILMAAAVCCMSRRLFSLPWLLRLLEPFEFKLPPPTPPPFVL